jgi:hypothetical protein
MSWSHKVSCPIERGRRTQPAQPDDQHPRFKQALLSLDADLVQQDVAAVAQQLSVVHAVVVAFEQDTDY